LNVIESFYVSICVREELTVKESALKQKKEGEEKDAEERTKTINQVGTHFCI
jgi:hypothetical protein